MLNKIDIDEMVRRFAIIRRELSRGLIVRREYDDEVRYITYCYFYGR